jgi:AcrR family transcriptional regulator
MREDLLLAAETVIERKGLAGLTIRDVLAEAGVAPATLYAYFAGKDDIIAELVGAVARRLVDGAEDSVGKDQADAAALWSLVRGGLSEPIPGAELLADVRGQAATPDQAATVRHINEQLVGGLRPLVERARERGAIATRDVDALVELLDIVWDGLTRRQRTDTFVTSYERVGGAVLDLLAASTGPRPQRAERGARSAPVS